MPFSMPNIYIDDFAKSKDHSILKALGIPSGNIDSDSGSDQSTNDEQSSGGFI